MQFDDSTNNKNNEFEPRNIAIILKAMKNSSFNVDAIIGMIKSEMPLARVTENDSFEAERKRLQTVKLRIQQESKMPSGIDKASALRGFDLVMASVSRRESAEGPGKNVSIPLDESGEITGRVWAKTILFRGKCDANQAQFRRLINLLCSLQLGQLTIYPNQ